MGPREIAAMLVACAGCGGEMLPLIPPPPDSDGAVDAGNDGVEPTVVADASTGPAWCSTHFPYATLCDDFDLAMVPRPEWSASGPGLNVAATAFTSAPHALHVQGAAMTSSYLAFDVPSAQGGAKLEADLQLVADGSLTYASDAVLASITAAEGQTVELAEVPGTTNGRCSFAGFAGSSTHTNFTLQRGSSWHSVSLKISFNDDSTINLICIVDGTDYGLYELSSNLNLGKVTFHVGALGTTTDPMEAYYDDVVIDVAK